MKQIIITIAILLYSLISFAQLDSNYHSESNYTVNKFGKLVSNVQPNMPAGFDAFGKSFSTKLDSAYIYDGAYGNSWGYYFYDANGIILKRKSVPLYNMSNYDSARTEYSFNSFGLIESTKQKFWNIISTFTDDSIKVFYEYNQDSLLIKKIEFKNRLNIFDTISLYEYIYDNNGRLISSIYSSNEYNDTVLIKREKCIYYFNNGILDSADYFKPDNFGIMSIDFKFYYIYNYVYQLSTIYKKGYITGQIEEKTVNSYNSNNLLVNSFVLSRFNVVMLDTLLPYSQYTYTYDSFFNRKTKVFQYVQNIDSSLTATWVDFYIDSLWFNYNSLMSASCYPYNIGDILYVANYYDFNIYDNNSPSKYTKYSRGPDDLLHKNVQFDFFYSNFNVGINESKQEKIEVNISPNPFKESFIVRSKNLEKSKRINVYNIVGKLVYSQNIISKDEVINLPNIAPGVYFIRILSNGNSVLATKKVIKL